MKRIIPISLIIFFLWEIQQVSAQTGVISTDGVYMPRLTTANRNAIATPANGQLIYNTDDNCFNVYQSGTWQKLCGIDTPPSDTWTKKADFGGTPRNYAAGFSIGNKGYIGVGGSNTDFWEYDPTTNAWTQKANFGGTVNESAGGFSIASKGYIGTDATNGDNFYEYDPNTNTWTMKTFAPFYPYSAGFSIGSKGYFGGGRTLPPLYEGGGFFEYDPNTNLWTEKASPGPYFGGVGFSIGNKGYIGTGAFILGSGGTVVTKAFGEYDPVANTWTPKASFGGVGRSGATGFAIGNKGYIGTGSPGGNDFWEYDPISNTWTQKTNFGGTARSGAVGFSIGNKGYIGTGGFSNDFWEYNPFATSPGITTQGNIFNGPDQLVQLDGAGSIAGNLTLNGDVILSGTLNMESFIAPALLNSWVNYNAPTYEAAGYAKDKESRIMLKGTIKSGTAASGTVLFNLPAGYRPTEIMMFAVTNDATALGRVDVFPNGDVKIMSGGNTLLSLGQISFKVN